MTRSAPGCPGTSAPCLPFPTGNASSQQPAGGGVDEEVSPRHRPPTFAVFAYSIPRPLVPTYTRPYTSGRR